MSLNTDKQNTPFGKDVIKDIKDDIPNLPGIYKMLNKAGDVIYIGKARNLQKRIISYLRPLNRKNEVMVSLIYNINYIVTNSESDALILEANLIRKLKPKYNILLKDDKSFLYLKIDLMHDYPSISRVFSKDIESKNKKNMFFGPFNNRKLLDNAIDEIQTIFKLRSCSDSYFQNRERACMLYQIKKCSAPCVGKISMQNYKQSIIDAQNFLSGNLQELKNNLQEQMYLHSENLDFEKAAMFRDRINALNYTEGKKQSIINDIDIIILQNIDNNWAVGHYIFKNNIPISESINFFNKDDTVDESSDFIENIILQLYQNISPAKNILINHEIESCSLDIIINALYDIYNYKVKILCPKLSDKKYIIDNLAFNVHLSLERHIKKNAHNIALFQEIKNIFNLKSPPRRIEVYDNSHIQGEFAIGAMVVATPNGFDKKEYRIYNIKSNIINDNHYIGDDYLMLSEVLSRRFNKIKESPDKKPDLIIIDGGKGHLSTALKIQEKYNHDIVIVAMSKGIERNKGEEGFHMKQTPSFTLDNNLLVMKYLQILRDEVHNFAINSHRKKRSKNISKSSLDDIEQIGVKRKQLLLQHFGSVKMIRSASVNDIAKVPNISKKLAKIIWQYLNSDNQNI